MRKSLWVILLNLFYLLGSAQNITVSPELVCPNQTSSLTTDTTQNVHIGDIICVDNVTGDTLIVSPSQWEALSATHTPVSVVFFVDESGEHGWAVGLPSQYGGQYPQANWTNGTPPCLTNLDLDGAFSDFDGEGNTECMRTNTPTWPANTIPNSFYIPAAGQLSMLYTQQLAILSSIRAASAVVNPDWNDYNWPTNKGWWSSTSSTYLTTNNLATAFSISTSGVLGTTSKTGLTNRLYFIPVMNF